jgi:WD40 repeat protein
LWNIAAASITASLNSPDKHAAVWDAVYSPDGKTVADITSDRTAYDKGSVFLWKVTSPGRPIAVFPDPHGTGVGAVAFAPNGKFIAAADGEGTVYLLNAATLKVARSVQGPAMGSGYNIDGLAFSPDGSELAGVSSDGSIYVWKTAGLALVSGPLPDPDGQIASGIAFSPDGSMVADSDTDGNAYLWDLVSGKVIRTFHDPAGLQVTDVAFTPNGKVLVTTSASGKYNHDSAIRVWNAATAALLHTFYDTGSYGANRLAISPDGRFLAVADTNAHAYVWSLSWLYPG